MVLEPFSSSFAYSDLLMLKIFLMLIAFLFPFFFEGGLGGIGMGLGPGGQPISATQLSMGGGMGNMGPGGKAMFFIFKFQSC